jgi:hypothetical protein
MKLDVIRFGCTVSILWALIVFSVGIPNLIWPSYGVEFLKIIDSIYPGYHFGLWGFGGIIVATMYAAIDGWVVGAVFALLYNFITRKKRS